METTQTFPKYINMVEKPDFSAKAKDIARVYEFSAFTDEEWLAKTIKLEFEKIWEQAKRWEENRITAICEKKGWIG